MEITAHWNDPAHSNSHALRKNHGRHNLNAKFEMYELKTFRLPNGFRGRPALYVQIWWIVSAIFFRPSPQVLYNYRNCLLRLFGANIGKGVLIRPSVTVTYPWKLKIKDYSWIGDDVVLYTLGEIEIGSNTVISQKSYLCAADHDHRTKDFKIRQRPILIGSGTWIAADCFIGPGVTIGDNIVIAARSTSMTNILEPGLYAGNPAIRKSSSPANSKE